MELVNKQTDKMTILGGVNMTVQELYDWAKERNLLDEPIAKHFNFNIEYVTTVTYLPKEVTKDENKIVLD